MRPKLALRLVVASPSDVEGEASSLPSVVQEVNRTLALAGRDVFLEVARWKTDIYPGLHIEGPQALIDSILSIDQCDIFLAIFWKRLGSAGTDGKSGTEHEIQVAWQAFANSGRPHVMLYFSEAPYCPTSPDETDEWGKVLKLKAFYRDHGLYSAYTPETFTDRARSHLLSYVFANYPPAAVPQITAMSLPALVRAESRTDIIGDVLLHFSGYPLGTYDIRLMINTAITNPVDSDLLTDVYLTVEGGTKLARGRLAALSVLAFLAVPISSTQFDMRISGVRASISTLSFVENAQVTGAVSIQPIDGSASPTTIGPNLTLGFSKRGFAFRAWAADESRLPLRLYTMEGVNAQLVANPGAHDAKINLYLQFTELLPGFFKTMAEEGPSASWGTRLKIELAPLPPGAQIFVTTRDIPVSRDAPARAVLVPLEDGPSTQLGIVPEGSGGTVDGVPIMRVQGVEPRGHAVAVWEWVKERPSPTIFEDVVFGVIVVAEPGYPAFAPVSLHGNLAPINWKPVGPIPRFAPALSSSPFGIAALSLQPRGEEDPWR